MPIHKVLIPRCLYTSFVILVLVLGPHLLCAQQVDSISHKASLKKTTRQLDSLSRPIHFSIDSATLQPNKVKEPKRARRDKFLETNSIVVKPHSAKTALLLSILPGAGQVYNHQAWKIPIIYAVLGTMGYFVYDNYTQMAAFKKEYIYRINNPGSVKLEGYESYPNASIYNLYQSYNQNFQLMVIISAGLYALNLVDAFVFGHLFDFQINDDLALKVSPSVQTSHQMSTPVPSVGFSIRF